MQAFCSLVFMSSHYYVPNLFQELTLIVGLAVAPSAGVKVAPVARLTRWQGKALRISDASTAPTFCAPEASLPLP